MMPLAEKNRWEIDVTTAAINFLRFKFHKYVKIQVEIANAEVINKARQI